MKFTTLMLRLLFAVACEKKGGDAPPPDPSIGEAQLRLTELAERQQDWYEGKIAPELMAQMKRSTDISSRVADANLEQMDFQTGLARKYDERYWGTQVPLEDEMIAKARKYNEADERERMAGAAGADVEQAAAIGDANVQRGLRLRGINLGSAGAISAMRESSDNTVLAKAGAMNKTREVARQLGWQRLGEAAALGRGLPGFGAGSSGLALGAGQGAVGAGTAGLGAVTGAAATGFGNTSSQGGLYGNVGQLGAASYGTQSSNWKTAVESDPTMEIVGTVAGAAATFF
jgi:hypothetical protein